MLYDVNQNLGNALATFFLSFTEWGLERGKDTKSEGKGKKERKRKRERERERERERDGEREREVETG